MESMCASEIQEYEGSKDEQIIQKVVSIRYWDGMLYTMCKMDERVDFSGEIQVMNLEYQACSKDLVSIWGWQACCWQDKSSYGNSCDLSFSLLKNRDW
jgi:hypothetical protein